MEKLCNVRFNIDLTTLSYASLEDMLRYARAFDFITSPGRFNNNAQWYVAIDGALMHQELTEKEDLPEVVIAIDIADGSNINALIQVMSAFRARKRFCFVGKVENRPSVSSSHLWKEGVAGRIEFGATGPYVSEIRQIWDKCGDSRDAAALIRSVFAPEELVMT